MDKHTSSMMILKRWILIAQTGWGRIIRYIIPDIFMFHRRFHIVQPRQASSCYTSREELGGVGGARGSVQNPDQHEHALHTLSCDSQRNDKTLPNRQSVLFKGYQSSEDKCKISYIYIYTKCGCSSLESLFTRPMNLLLFN